MLKLKKKVVIAGLALGCVLALAPVAAQADGPAAGTANPSLFQTQEAALDQHQSQNEALFSRYSSTNGSMNLTDPNSAYSSFVTSNQCLYVAKTQAVNGILAIQNTPAYQAAFANYQAKCGANNPSAPKFMINSDIDSDMVNNLRQVVGIVTVHLSIQNGSGAPINLPISVSHAKPASSSCSLTDITCDVAYAAIVNPNPGAGQLTPACPNTSIAASDLNTGLISSQVINVLNTDANACSATNGSIQANQSLRQQALADEASALGQTLPANGAAQGSSGIVSNSGNGEWGPAGSSAGGNLR